MTPVKKKLETGEHNSRGRIWKGAAQDTLEKKLSPDLEKIRENHSLLIKKSSEEP